MDRRTPLRQPIPCPKAKVCLLAACRSVRATLTISRAPTGGRGDGQSCTNFKVEELGEGRCRAGPHEDASAAPLPPFARPLLLAAAGFAWLLAALA